MAYTPKPNKGTLWPNDNKREAKHPDLRGDIYLDRDFLKDQLDTQDTDLIKIQIAGWDVTITNKSCLNIEASKPYMKEAAPVVRSRAVAVRNDDEDVPF
jgi:hypothetical protein